MPPNLTRLASWRHLVGPLCLSVPPSVRPSVGPLIAVSDLSERWGDTRFRVFRIPSSVSRLNQMKSSYGSLYPRSE
jgi:hypothetical protein